MLISARNNQFLFNLPRDFIPKYIADKYRPYLNKMPGNMITEPIDFLNYGIQSLNLPGPSFQPVEQTDYPGNVKKWRSSLPLSTTRDPKECTITMQAFDGYINYNVPSIGSKTIWGIDYMPEEIGLCHQKGSLTEV